MTLDLPLRCTTAGRHAQELAVGFLVLSLGGTLSAWLA